MWNPFKALYDWLFVNHTIDEQMMMHRADLIMLQYYKKQLEKTIYK
jgi:hypothetical protein